MGRHGPLQITITALLFLVFQGCGSSFYGQAQPKIETWGTTTSSTSPSVAQSEQSASLPSTTSSLASGWKEIFVGKTTRQEIEARFGQGKSSKGRLLYQVDAIPTLITYSDDNVVRSIRVTPPVQMNESALLAAYGKADRERRTDDFLRMWEYDRAGMSIEFAPDNTTTAAIDYHAPTLLLDTVANRSRKAALPTRPALVDASSSLASVQAVLNQSSPGFSWVGANEEYGQAQQLYSLLHQKWPVITDREMQRYLIGVMDRLSAVTPKPPFPWTVRVVDASTLNAMNLGGGIILLNSGLFQHLDSEAQLAYVVAHEMGHQLKHHLAAIQTKQQFAQLLLGAAVLATAGAGHPEAARAVNSLGSLAAGATLASFSRTQETEADLIGLHILNAAEYDPREAVKVMEKFIELRNLHGSSIPLFSTHPDPEVRLANVQQWLGSLGEVDYSKRLVTTQEFAEFKDTYRY
ncbi:MAG: M48 family metalloprotease [Deltaproteobacteria bacterium]|nr:M48 family metalloprotease [Deltaproteobacteria bacterium]